MQPSFTAVNVVVDLEIVWQQTFVLSPLLYYHCDHCLYTLVMVYFCLQRQNVFATI